MKGLGIAATTLSVTAILVAAGLSGKRVLFVEGPRSAVLVLGTIGMLFCTISVGKFVTQGPAHPLSIVAYVVGTVALTTFLGQVFRWNLPLVGDPRNALYVLAGCIVVKTVIGRFAHLLT